MNDLGSNEFIENDENNSKKIVESDRQPGSEVPGNESQINPLDVDKKGLSQDFSLIKETVYIESKIQNQSPIKVNEMTDVSESLTKNSLSEYNKSKMEKSTIEVSTTIRIKFNDATVKEPLKDNFTVSATTLSSDTNELKDESEYFRKIGTIEYATKPGSIEEAKKYRNKTCVRRRIISGYEEYPIFSTSISEMGKYGVGIELYFSLLKYLTILFFVISLFSIPAIIINASDDGLTAGDIREKWDTWNVSNLNPVSDPSELDSNETKLKKLFALDSIYSSIFIIFLFFFQIYSRKIIDKNKEDNLTLANFSIEAKGFPTENLNSEEICNHFSQFGAVGEVYVARKYGGYIDFFQVKSALIFESEYLKNIKDKNKTHLKKMKKIEKKLEKLKMKNFTARPHDSLPAISAFVVFESIISKDNCLKSYLKDKGCCKLLKNQKENLKFLKTFPLSVKKTLPPNNIIWENLEISATSRFFRQVFIFLSVVVFMIISIIILYELKSYQSNFPSDKDCIGINPDVDLTYAKTYYTTTLEKNCYCRKQPLDKLLSNSKYTSYCLGFLELISETVALKVFVSLGIIIINQFINIIITKLNKIQRYHSRSEEQFSLMKKVFFFTFINTTILTTMINANFSGLKTSEWLNSYVFNGDYIDFSRKWYVNVGGTIVVTLAVMGFMKTIFNLFIVSFFGCIKRRVSKKSTLTQREMNSKFAGQDFNIASRNAFVLNMVFSCFLYSGGLPFLNLICFFTLFLLYWTDKIIFLKYCKKPPRYNHLLHSSFLKFLPFAVILHCGISLYMYGASDIFPSHVDDQGNYQDNTISDRINKFTGYVNLILLLITFLCFVWYFCYSQVYLKLREKRKLHSLIEDSSEPLQGKKMGCYNILENVDYHDLIIAIEN